MVLPSLHSMSRPPLGGVEGTGLEEALGLCWNWPGVGKGWFLSTCQTTSTPGGAFASCSHTALCMSISACHRKSPTLPEELGAGKKEALPSGKPISWLLSLTAGDMLPGARWILGESVTCHKPSA